MDNIKVCISAALGRRKADLVLKNAWVADVFSQCIYKGDVAIIKDLIIGIGKYQGFDEIDCEGLYVSPAFIDAHVHVESSKVIPSIFSEVVLKGGVTGCIADPHEIANVLGVEGIDFMLEDSCRADIDIFYMMPSCVPAVDFEDSGAVLNAEALSKYAAHDFVLGLGEVMNVPAVVGSDEAMLKKLLLFKDKNIDGHCPGIDWRGLNVCSSLGISTDHECASVEQAFEEIRRGMYVMLREGSAAKNLKSLLPAVNEGNYHRFLFCTDDKDIIDLEREGSIDHNIRLAIKHGLDPLKAITIASFNAAKCYGLKNRGAVAPGYIADLVILKSIEDVEIVQVIRKGRILKSSEYSSTGGNFTTPSMFINHVSSEMFMIKAESNSVNVINVIEGSIETTKRVMDVKVEDGFVSNIPNEDVLKIAVFERHKGTGEYSLGFIKGLGVKGCSIAQTIAHDSHNIIVIGDDDKDMAQAVNRVIDMKGGISVVSSGRVIGELDLPVAGLMTDKTPEYVIERLECMREAVKRCGGSKTSDIFTTLSFMALPVIPQIKITTRGLYDFTQGQFINLFCI